MGEIAGETPPAGEVRYYDVRPIRNAATFDALHDELERSGIQVVAGVRDEAIEGGADDEHPLHGELALSPPIGEEGVSLLRGLGITIQEFPEGKSHLQERLESAA